MPASAATEAALTDKLGATPDAEPLLHPALAAIYRDKVGRLKQALRTPGTPQEAFELIRGLIDSIQLVPVGNDLEIELRGGFGRHTGCAGIGQHGPLLAGEQGLANQDGCGGWV